MLLDRQDKAKSQELIAKSCYDLSVIIPRGIHPFPSRTRKLSPAGPIVLHAKVCGRVGRRRHKNQRPRSEMSVAFFVFGPWKVRIPFYYLRDGVSGLIPQVPTACISWRAMDNLC